MAKKQKWVGVEDALNQIMQSKKCSRERAAQLLAELCAKGEVRARASHFEVDGVRYDTWQEAEAAAGWPPKITEH